MVGGLTSINLTKIDVLCGLKEVKIGVKYIIDGKPVEGDRMPSTISELSKVEMVYEGSYIPVYPICPSDGSLL